VTAGIAAKWRTFTGLSSSLRALIILSFAVALGSYMITPFIGVLMVRGVGLNVRTAGVVVAAATFIQFGGSTLGVLVVDRIGLKRTMVLALGLRTLGLLLLGIAIHTPWLAYPAVVLVAGGPALYLPANKAYIVSCVSADLRPLFLGISSAALNAGMGLGPLIAALLIDVDPLALLVSAAFLFALIAVAHQIALRPLARRQESANDASRALGRTSRRSALRSALRPVLFTGFAYYLYFFFQSFVGLYTSARSDTEALGWAMLVNCTVVVVLQPRLSGWIARAGYRPLLASSFLLMAGGTAVMSVGGIATLLAGTALFSFGEVFLFLRCDLEMVKRVPDDPTFAFGVQRLTAGVGGLLAGVVGGFLFAHFQNARDLGMFWIAVSIQCVVATLVALAFGSRRVPARLGPKPVLEPLR
jgi:predicted MFS family arabinose efflux permease